MTTLPIIAVVGRVGTWHSNDLRRVAERRFELRFLDFESLHAEVGVHAADALELSALRYQGGLVRAMPRGSLEQVVFRMNVLLHAERQGLSLINSARSIEACIDKYYSLSLLAAAGVPVPKTLVTQSAEQGLTFLDRLGGRAVLKPLFGSEGRRLTKIESRSLAQRWFPMLVESGQVLYLQEFIPHAGWDLRLLVVGSQVYGMKRSNQQDWRLNAARGASVAPHIPNTFEADLALRCAGLVNAQLCGVDLIYDTEGRPYILELNASPGWHFIQSATGIDISQRVLDLF